MSIGTNIRSLREERGFTQEQVADSLGVTFQAVSSWERDEYKPDIDKIIKLADFFNISVSALVEEKQVISKSKEATFSVENLKTYVKTTAKNLGLTNTLKAVTFATEAHKGQMRKRSTIPYIYHPLTLASHALSMNITDDAIIATCLLHDVVEDCNVSYDDLPVNDETKELVRLLTCEKTTPENRSLILNEYYEKIATNAKATLIKCIDRTNNITTMSWGLSRERIYRMIKETEEYYPRLIEVLKEEVEYSNAAWLLKYQMESLLDVHKRLM